jgi:hypothetical protein
MATNFAEKFTTTAIAGGVRVQVVQDNPGEGKGTVPAAVSLKLFGWNTNYTTTVAGTALVHDKAVVTSEEVENGYMWIFLFFKPLPTGTYLWLLTVDDGHDKGVFKVRYDSGSTYNNAFEDGVSKNYDFYSDILGLDSETHEKVMSVGDTFTGCNTSGGHAEVKINRNTVASPSYANSLHAQDTVVDGSGVKIGRVATGGHVKVA